MHLFVPYSPRFLALSFSILLFLTATGLKPVKAQGGYTLDFNGSNEYVEIPYDAALNPATVFTIEVWAKIEGGSGSYRSPITSRNGAGLARGYKIYATPSNTWDFWVGNGATWDQLSSGVTVTSDWTHIACVYDGTNQIIYINGEEAASAPGTYVANASMPARIGAGATEGPAFFHFNGKVDEVRIWSDVRTAAEIRGNMHKELGGSEANLVGYYQMSNGSGTSLTDNSTNSNTGTFTNTPTWETSGALAGPGMALDFDGTSEYVDCGYDASIALSTAGTMEAWIKADAMPTADALLVHKYWSYGLELESDGNIQVYWHGTTVEPITTTTAPISTGVWYHLAAVYDGSTQYIYINGELVTSGATSGTITANSNALCIGAHALDLIRDFDGMIDEVRVWNDARSQAEIRANMYRTLDGDEGNLVAYYRFDQQTDATHTTLYDYSGNGNDGTLTSMDAATDWVASSPFNTWIGSEDSDWSNADNWSRGSVPSTEDVGLFAWGGSNAPASGNINARHAYVASGLNTSQSGNLTLSGNLVNEGTYTTTGTVTFSGSAAQTLSGGGTTTIGSMDVDNASGLTLEKDLTITTDLDLSRGAFILGANTLTLNGSITSGLGSFTGSSSSNISFGGSGASATLPAVTLKNLTLNRANGMSLGGGVTVEGQLSLTNGDLTLNSQTLTLGDAASTSGAGASSHIIATSGTLRKEYSSDGSFQYPAGDGTYYTPITLDFTASGYASAYADVDLTTSKHPNNASSSHYLSRYWTVSSSGISDFSCDVTAVYDENDITGTESEMVGGKWDGAEWTDLGAVNTGSNQITGTVSSFSDFTAGEATAFPVEWLGFNAQVSTLGVTLNWQTATELNADYFGVERSADRSNWTELGRVAATGTSTRVQEYTYADLGAQTGEYFYRLRQVDLDGRHSYSAIRRVYLEPQLELYPNPVSAKLNLELPPGRWSARLFDLQGREVLRIAEAGEGLDLQVLPAGSYQLILVNEQGISLSRKVRRQ